MSYGPRWFFRDGTVAVDAPVGTRIWEKQVKVVNDLLGDPRYKIVERTKLPNGVWVSTVWLGLDQYFGLEDEPHTPIIFESMVFDTNKRKKYKIGKTVHTSIGAEVDIRRYSTEKQALAGHKRLVKKYTEWSQEKI